VVGPTLTFDDLLRQVPLIHNDRTRTWAIHTELAAFLDHHVGPETVTLETGAGLSTLVILRKKPRLHVAVQPYADEFAAITEFASAHAIDMRAFRGVVARSQDYLPTAELPRLDLVLIDGDHSFPAPFLDWYYAAERLNVGGLLIVDDIQIGTGAILAAFLTADPGWEEVVVQPERFAVYRKRAESACRDNWVLQPFLRDSYPTAAVHLTVSGQPSVQELQANLQELRTELEAARTLVQSVTTERDEANDAGQRAIQESQATHRRLEAMTTERDAAAAAARTAVDRIRAMESSKFWRLRGVWFRAKRLIGIDVGE